jgi:hypothetical protein
MALTEDRKALVETILNTLREDPSLLEEFRRLLVPEIVVFLPDLKLIAERQASDKCPAGRSRGTAPRSSLRR